MKTFRPIALASGVCIVILWFYSAALSTKSTSTVWTLPIRVSTGSFGPVSVLPSSARTVIGEIVDVEPNFITIQIPQALAQGKHVGTSSLTAAGHRYVTISHSTVFESPTGCKIAPFPLEIGDRVDVTLDASTANSGFAPLCAIRKLSSSTMGPVALNAAA
jgi:hypothetical protein